jgi:hypothetical protein
MRLRINKELNSKPDTALHKNYFKPAVGLYAQRGAKGRRASAASLLSVKLDFEKYIIPRQLDK